MPNQPLKLTEFKFDRLKQIPYRRAIIQDPKDKRVNCIYNSNEVIYGSYQDESIMKLINPSVINVDASDNIIHKYNINLAQDESVIEQEIFAKLQVGDILNIYNYNTDTIIKDVKIEKLEPAGSYFVLYLAKEITLLSTLFFSYDTHMEYQKIEIIKGEDQNNKIPVELQYKKQINSNDNSYSYTFRDGTIEKYDTNGQLQSVEYPKDKIIFSYISQEKNCGKFSCKLIDSDLQPIIQ